MTATEKYMTNMPPMVNSKDDARDHFQTPAYAVAPLFPYLKPEWRIWEPAAGKGNIASALYRAGYKVIGSDVMMEVDSVSGIYPDVDFLTMSFIDSQIHCHAIVTNPPFSKKDQFIARCYELGKPWALLLPLTALEGIKRQALYKQHGLELIVPNRRIAFETPSGKTGKDSSPQFLTAWYTWGLNVGSSLTFVDLPKPEPEKPAIIPLRRTVIDTGLFAG